MRNLGLLSFAVCEAMPVALVLRLCPDAPRYIEAAEQTDIAGISVPLIRLWPDTPVLVLRAERALAQFGLAA